MKIFITISAFCTLTALGSFILNSNNTISNLTDPPKESTEFIVCNDLFDDCWDELPQTQFWKRIMLLSKDSVVLNVASTRNIIEILSQESWGNYSDEDKENYRKKKRIELGLDSNERIFATTGKSDFYKFDLVIKDLEKGIKVFKDNQVDPWYAQTIMLIECPGQLKKSTAGAYGAFQLMPGVARSHGLIVNKKLDERKDFEKCAKAASEVISEICIPHAKSILERYNINPDENELWFKLFTLHIYHAGAMNVAAVVEKINPDNGSKKLIQDMWKNKAASFGNSSQNYSQLALAANLILSQMLSNETHTD